MDQKSPHRILLIEDNPADVALLRHALNEQAEPFVLEVLPDGERALEFVRGHFRDCGPDPCLIVLDLNLPRYDGTVVLKAIKSDPELANIDIVVLTNLASPSQREQVLALGVRAYRTKPMDWDETVSLARELIEICSGPARQAAVF